MAALFEKDIRLILQRKQSLIIFILISLLIGYSAEGTFILGYMPLLFTILAVSTISYDEAENGFSYLFALPVDRKTYVYEKYIFSIGAEVIAYILAYAIFVVTSNIKGFPIDIMATLPMNLTYIPMVAVIFVITIPVQLKFGIEASRVAMISVCGVLGVVVFLTIKIIGEEKIDDLVYTMANFPAAYLIVGACVATIGLILISLLASILIMKKKEF